MARTRGAKSSSPSNARRVCERSQFQILLQSLSRKQFLPGEASAAKASGKTIPYQVRGRPLQKRPRVESSEPIDLTEQSPEPSPIPTPVPSPVPRRFPCQFRPVPSPARKKNLRSLKRHFRAPNSIRNSSGRTFRVRPELAQSFQLLRRYHIWSTCYSKRLFLSPDSHGFLSIHDNQRGRNPTLIHFTIDGRHGILGARHIAEALQIPFEPTQFDNFRAWANPTELRWCAPFPEELQIDHILRGELPPVMFLIDAFLPLLYFEEKVHKRSFRELIAFPPLSKAAMPNFGASGIPSEPQLERKRICLAAPAIPRAPPAASSSQPSTSAEPRMAIPISEYRELCRALETLTASQSSLAQEMAAIRACQEQMLATQAQQAAILRQLQVHFDLPQAVEPSTDTPAEPHSHPSESHPPEPQAPADAPTEEADPSA
ncbi:hypothetical protein CK203_105244 [Vitis vinifera]|uniref:Uncharacterized protein n=2 Tax=Vitis vinifera TaxID=29760 RepID=A0A438C5D7_VITVI|nr:hypothetical protein CK203_105244 [Vitis vinifera]